MKRISGILATATVLAIAAGSAMLFGVDTGHASDETEFTVVTDLDTFKAHFIGPKIMDPEDSANYFVIREDGSIVGNWHGKEMAGDWRWDDQYFCRSLSAPRAAPEDCQEWGFAEGKARLVRNRGAGDATIYLMGE
jgi:hypothetical protein